MDTTFSSESELGFALHFSRGTKVRRIQKVFTANACYCLVT